MTNIMADEFEELGIDSGETQDNSETTNKIEKRMSELNKKVILTSKERDELADLNKELEAEKENAIKERDFYKGFSAISSRPEYQSASEYQEKILEKVNSGYDVEDATIAILAREGKYQPPAPEVETESPAGGSAVNQVNLKADKAPGEMNKEELRAALVEAEKKGELSIN